MAGCPSLDDGAGWHEKSDSAASHAAIGLPPVIRDSRYRRTLQSSLGYWALTRRASIFGVFPVSRSEKVQLRHGQGGKSRLRRGPSASVMAALGLGGQLSHSLFWVRALSCCSRRPALRRSHWPWTEERCDGDAGSRSRPVRFPSVRELHQTR